MQYLTVNHYRRSDKTVDIYVSFYFNLNYVAQYFEETLCYVRLNFRITSAKTRTCICVHFGVVKKNICNHYN